MFSPIRTERLLLRPAVEGDAVSLAARRSDPLVAEYQAWAIPYPLSRATALVAAMSDMDGPAEGRWWMATVVEAESGEVVGDVAVLQSSEGRVFEIGYTLAREHWGRGYATEAVGAMVDWLFTERGAARVWALVHAANRPSMRVLERTGFLYEGTTRSSFWVGEVGADEAVYGLTRLDWETWRSRVRTPPGLVELVAVTRDNEGEVFRLRSHKSQEAFVAPMPVSFADALFPEVVEGAPVVPWMRGVVADGEMVGFVMLALRTEHHAEPYLWRLLVDRLHQRRGIGGRVLDLVAAECREMGDGSLLTSWVEGDGSPAPFYRAHGFEPTGRIVDGETEGRWRFG